MGPFLPCPGAPSQPLDEAARFTPSERKHETEHRSLLNHVPLERRGAAARLIVRGKPPPPEVQREAAARLNADRGADLPSEVRGESEASDLHIDRRAKALKIMTAYPAAMRALTVKVVGSP